MNEQIKNRLIGGLDKSLEDCHVKISAAYVESCGNGDTETINQCLNEWQQAGLLRIIRPYEQCRPEDICVKMLNFIESDPPHDRFWDNPYLLRQINEE